MKGICFIVLPKAFEKFILSCVDEVLSSLGPNVKRVIIFYLLHSNMRFEEVPQRPEDFSKFLHTIYGDAATVLEKMIVASMKRKSKIKIESEGFVNAVKEIKMKWKRF